MGWSAFFHGVERFRSISNSESRRAHIGFDVLTADRNCVFNADGVIEINHWIDTRQTAVTQDPFAKSFS
ncbi:hypothetical protein D9M71_770910 [compost metagenome]